MYTLPWHPLQSMRSTCVHRRPGFFPKDSFKSFYRALSDRKKLCVSFLLPPQPKQTWVITGCSALRWTATAPHGAAGQPGIAIVLLLRSSTPERLCSPSTPAEIRSPCAAHWWHQEVLQIFEWRGGARWGVTRAFGQKEIRSLLRAAAHHARRQPGSF